MSKKDFIIVANGWVIFKDGEYQKGDVVAEVSCCESMIEILFAGIIDDRLALDWYEKVNPSSWRSGGKSPKKGGVSGDL